MVGQKRLIESIEYSIEKGNFPKFSVLVGPKGSGKRTLAKYIGRKLPDCTTIVLEDNKIETIRMVIDDSRKNRGRPTLYVIPDADTMSVNAKNALLKITEEPPEDTYIIMTVINQYTMLQTIMSRAYVMFMDNYMPYELREYALGYADMKVSDYDRVAEFCEVPGDIDNLKRCDIDKFLDFLDLVIENIALVEGANAFKIGEKLALKDEENKFDLTLFWRAFTVVCFHRGVTMSYTKDYLDAIRVTGNHLRNLRATGINKQMEFDKWVLDIREIWLEE